MITLSEGDGAAMRSGVQEPVRERPDAARVAQLVVLLAEPEVEAADARVPRFADHACAQHPSRRVVTDRRVARDEPGELARAADDADVDRGDLAAPFERREPRPAAALPRRYHGAQELARAA